MKPEFNRRNFMKTSALTGAMAFAACGSAKSGSGPAFAAEPRLLGTWKMVDYFFETETGERLYPWGPHPVGLLLIDDRGNLAAQGMFDAPREISPQPTQEEQANAYRTYNAYYGNYTLDLQTKTLTTRVTAGLDPSWKGSDQIRHYSFDGPRLVLKTNPRKIGEVQASGVFFWEKAG
jgi:hypothetical protein